MSKIKKLGGVEYIKIADVIIGERLRQDTPAVKAKVEEIARSIKELGPLQPVVIDEKNQLIDGGCRIQAYQFLGVDEVPYVRRFKVTDSKRIALEVEANLRRSDLTWQEKVMAIGKVHYMKEAEAAESNEEWGQRATGSLLNVNVASVNNALQVYKLLLAKDNEIASADSLKDAMLILVERKRNKAIQYRMATTGEAPKVVEEQIRPITFALGNAKTNPISAPIAATVVDQKSDPIKASKHIDLSKILFNTDCVAWMHAAPKDSVDVIVTDIPYGVDLDNMEDISNIDMMRDTHNVEANVELMPKFIEAAYHILRPNSYLLFFYALQHHEKLRDWGTASGFKVQDWPLMWLKPHSCKNNAPQCNWTKSFEPVMVMKKGSPVLNTRMTKCHLEVDGMPDKKQQSNPFAKPLEFLSQMIFKPLGLQPGAICLDPFAGEGSILSAAVLHGLQPIGLELDEMRFPALVSRMQRLYKNVLNTTVDFTLPPMTFKQQHD